MSITVREVWKLKEFRAFQLAAGEGGLDNPIDGVGILDYEYVLDQEDETRKWKFRKNDFMISSLLFAKGHPELLLDAVTNLCRDRVAALAVKNVCYPELPQEVLDYADAHDFPIFMFGRYDAFFEEIVVCLKSRIQERSSQELREYRISLLLNGELDLSGERELNHELMQDRLSHFRVLYCRIREDGSRLGDYHSFYRLQNQEDGPVFYYKGGCFIVHYLPTGKASGADQGSGENIQSLERNFDLSFLKWQLKLPPEQYWIGISELYETPDEKLREALTEALCAQQYAQLMGEDCCFFQNMGIYQILLPCYQEEWFQRYTEQMIQPILKFDRLHEGELYQTAREYVKSRGNIQEVSEAMHLHKNTVRYRINKIRELLNMEEKPGFDVALFIAFMLEELNQWF